MRLALPSTLFTIFLSGCAAVFLPEFESSLVKIFDPSKENFIRDKTASARSLLLHDGTILVSFDIDPADGKVNFPIYRSTDHGKTFSKFSEVVDQANHGGLRYEAHMIQLSRPFAGLPAGTILFAGNAIPDSHATTNLDLYASRDNGKQWNYLSTMASGGEAFPVNGKTPVWEPYLLHYKYKLICYYSDQREPQHYGQKMVHTTSSDSKTWSAVVNDVTGPKKDFRPGMPVVSQMKDGRFFMTYEYFGAREAAFAVYFKISSDPEQFGQAEGRVLRTTDGHVPISSPYNVVLKNGWIVVNAASSPDLFVNKNAGKGPWEVYKTHTPAAYSRGLTVGLHDREVYISSASPIGKKGQGNRVLFSIVKL